MNRLSSFVKHLTKVIATTSPFNMATMDTQYREAEVSSVTVMRSSAAERNKNAIVEVLKQLVPSGNIFALEIASGTGQHVAHFAEHLPHITWQPSECDDKSLRSIRGYSQISKKENIREPVYIDCTESVENWGSGSLAPASCDLIVCINMIHISPIAATEGLFKGSSYYLKPGGTLATYGPFKIHGEITPESNVQFDKMLKQQCSDWGLRDIDDLQKLAESNGMTLEKMVDMPANNKILVFHKNAS